MVNDCPSNLSMIACMVKAFQDLLPYAAAGEAVYAFELLIGTVCAMVCNSPPDVFEFAPGSWDFSEPGVYFGKDIQPQVDRDQLQHATSACNLAAHEACDQLQCEISACKKDLDMPYSPKNRGELLFQYTCAVYNNIHALSSDESLDVFDEHDDEEIEAPL
eukprot:10768575-Karenia_brevis.AAC.1